MLVYDNFRKQAIRIGLNPPSMVNNLTEPNDAEEEMVAEMEQEKQEQAEIQRQKNKKRFNRQQSMQL